MSSRPWSTERDGERRESFRFESFGLRRQRITTRLPRRARLIRRAELTSTGTVLLRFEVIDDEPFSFNPGQFVAVDLEHPRLGYRRSPYCLFGASTDKRFFELLVRVVTEGPISVFLGGLEIGDVVGFRGPSGHSMVPREPGTHLILLATGVGFGPCRCLLRHLVATESTRRVSLYWGLRHEEDICLLDELLELERTLTNFDWNISLSVPTSDWPPLQGRLTKTVPPLLSTLADKHFYLLSNGAMIAEMSVALRELGVASDRIYEESFFNHRHRPTRDEVSQVVSRFVARDLVPRFSSIFG